MWAHGCPQIAKSMMALGVKLNTNDYLAWKQPIYRHCPHLLEMYTKFVKANNDIAITGKKLNRLKGIVKRLSNCMKPTISQHINRLRKGIESIDVFVFYHSKEDS